MCVCQRKIGSYAVLVRKLRDLFKYHAVYRAYIACLGSSLRSLDCDHGQGNARDFQVLVISSSLNLKFISEASYFSLKMSDAGTPSPPPSNAGNDVEVTEEETADHTQYITEDSIAAIAKRVVAPVEALAKEL